MSNPNKFTVVPPRYKPRTDSVERDPASRVGTKLCTNIARDVDANGKPTGEFGCCTRDYCTFAHSIAELRLPTCDYGDRCYRRLGTKDKSGKIDHTNVCQFLHPGETNAEFFMRTGREVPDAPNVTTEKVRRPRGFKSYETKNQVPKNSVPKDPVQPSSSAPRWADVVDSEDDSEDELEVILDRMEIKEPEPIPQSKVGNDRVEPKKVEPKFQLPLEKEPEPEKNTDVVDLCVPKSIALSAIQALIAQGITKINVRIL